VKQRRLAALPVFVFAFVALFAVATVAYADDEGNLGPYRQIATIPVPSNFVFLAFGNPSNGGFDISFTDSERGRYYVADRGNLGAGVPPGIDVIDTRHDKFLYQIKLDTSANGVLVFHSKGESDEEDDGGAGTLVAGGSNSKTIFIDLAHPFSAPIEVPTGGNNRADELAYDPLDHLILIANDRDTPHPFVSFISVTSHTVVGQIKYDGSDAQHPLSTGGIEQPVWNARTRRFYIAIPSTKDNPNGEIDEINPGTKMITRRFPTNCGPAGLVVIPLQRLMTSCAEVLDIATGHVVKDITTTPPIVADEIWFNPGDERVYFGGITGSPVISALPPYNVFPPTPPAVAPGALPWVGSFAQPIHFSHSVAADSENNRIYVPVTNIGVLVFTDNAEDEDN
jgi:hypothetical protein